MSLSRTQLDEQLHWLETKVPVWLRAPDTFPAVFEEESEQLVAITAPKDQDYAWQQLEAIVERSGFNT